MNKMRLSKVKLYKSFFIVCLIGAIGFGSVMGILSQQIVNDRAALLNGVTKEDLTLVRPDGVTLGYSLIGNKTLDKSQPIPVVLLQHGVGGRRENFEPMALAFVARGFIVVTTTLRNHVGSTGYTTLGNAEADDILVILDSVKTTLGSRQILVKGIGVVGHSLGALTGTLVALRGHLNSCVAIAPPGNFSGLISNMVGKDLSELDSVFSGFNNYSDPAYLTNISIIAQDRPRNYLMIGGYEDTTVQEAGIRALFYKHMNSTDALDFTRYGTFQSGTAIELDFYHVKDHGSEQYPFMVPAITVAAINWTEQALGLTDGTGPIEIPAVIANYDPIFQLWGQLTGGYFVGFVFCVFFCGAFLFAFIANSKSSISSETDKEISKKKMGSLRDDMKSLFHDHEFHLVLRVTILVGCIYSFFYMPTSSFLLIQIPLSLLTPIFIGLCGGMLILILQRFKSGKTLSTIFNVSNFAFPLVGTLYGIVIAMCFTLVPVQLLLITGHELWLKPIPSIQGSWSEFFWFIICCVGIEMILNIFIQRNAQSRKGQKIFSLLVVPLILFLLGLLFGMCNANRAFILSIFGITLWIPMILALVLGLVGFFFEFLNLFYRSNIKAYTVGPLVLSWIIGWILLASSPAF